jgi:hypothetical protein
VCRACRTFAHWSRALAIPSRKAALFRLAAPQAIDPIPARIHAERSLSPRVSSSQIVFMRSGVTTGLRSHDRAGVSSRARDREPQRSRHLFNPACELALGERSDLGVPRLALSVGRFC